MRHIQYPIATALDHFKLVMVTVFTLPPIVGEIRTIAETVDSGHGRIEQRRLHTIDVLVG
jgi:hypothetical protein